MKVAVYQTDHSIGWSNAKHWNERPHNGVQSFLLTDLSLEKLADLSNLRLQGKAEEIANYLYDIMKQDTATLTMN